MTGTAAKLVGKCHSQVEVEFYDKNRAIQLLANFFGLTQDLAPKVEIQIITGVPRLSHPPAKGPPVIDVEKVDSP